MIPIVSFSNFLQGGAALKIINKSSEKVEYWYTSTDNNQKRWYQHSIESQETTWDWMWADYDSTYPLEIFINGLNNYNYFILFGFLSNNVNDHYFSINIDKYPKRPASGQINPDFNSCIWYNFKFHSQRWGDGSSHSKLIIGDFSDNWLTLNNTIFSFK